jgi:hypothetical protein
MGFSYADRNNAQLIYRNAMSLLNTRAQQWLHSAIGSFSLKLIDSALWGMSLHLRPAGIEVPAGKRSAYDISC